MSFRPRDKVHGLGQPSSYGTILFRYYSPVVIVSFVVSGNMTGLRSKSKWRTCVHPTERWKPTDNERRYTNAEKHGYRAQMDIPCGPTATSLPTPIINADAETT